MISGKIFLLFCIILYLFFSPTAIDATEKICASPGDQMRPKIIRTDEGEYIIVWEDHRDTFPRPYMQKLSENLKSLWEKNGRPVPVSIYHRGVTRLLISNGSGGMIWQNDDGISIYPHFSIDRNGQIEWELPSPSDYIPLGMVPDGTGGVFCLRTSPDPSGRFEEDVSIRIAYFDNRGLENWYKNLTVFNIKEDVTIHRAFISRVNKGEVAVTWIHRDGGVYAQRVDSTGRFLWSGGVRICEAKTNQFLLPEWIRIRTEKTNEFFLPEWIRIRTTKTNRIVWLNIYPDGSSGSIITWAERMNCEKFDGKTNVFAQRLDRKGKKVWGRKGVHVLEVEGPLLLRNYFLTGQGNMSGGVLITWVKNYGEIRAQYINGKGEPRWTQQGILVEKIQSDPKKLEIVADGTGGAIVHWVDDKQDYRVQRITTDGTPVWKKGGIALNDEKTAADGVDFTTDEKGGAVVACALGMAGEDSNIYVYKITPDGKLQ